jgi:hypothetical protein
MYESLLNAAASAARYAAHADFDEPNHTFIATVQNMGAYGSPTGAGVALAPGLAPANFQVSWTLDAKGVPLTLTVSVVNYTINAALQTFTWTGKPSVTVRYAGSYKS